jgi:hypothetical protein
VTGFSGRASESRDLLSDIARDVAVAEASLIPLEEAPRAWFSGRASESRDLLSDIASDVAVAEASLIPLEEAPRDRV